MTTEAFSEKAMRDLSAMTTVLMASVGDRAGLFKALASGGPATSKELSERAGVSERYVREWYGAMVHAGYLQWDPTTQRATLPEAYVPVLATEGQLHSMGGNYQWAVAVSKTTDELVRAFRTGEGIAQDSFDENLALGIERSSAAMYEHLLVDEWIAAVPSVKERLEKGVSVADVGCGGGRALIELAKEFPNSRYVGFDIFGPAVESARANARRAGVDDRVSFQEIDATKPLPDQFDVILSFDVVHDVSDPVAMLRSVRSGLRPEGIYVMVEPTGFESIEEVPPDPMRALQYAASLLYCLPVSLTGSGKGLGATGVTVSKVEELSKAAGFGGVRRVGASFMSVFELRR
ncbi:MAG: methyltransferase domain-containing protein [Myxococcales bacterium]|nr:methyltransferase domain-containing protein [Myxococcales bacterium]